MKESLVKYVCSECGHEESKWMGRCPDCGQWNTFTEEKVISAKIVKDNKPIMDNSIRRLSDIPFDKTMRVSSRINEFDRVLGGGLVKGSLILLGGEPGIGKSTLILQLCDKVQGDGQVLYVSGEESAEQIKLRADRLRNKK